MRSAIERFEAKVERVPFTDCWIWIGAVKPNGYGDFHFRNGHVSAHQAAYALHVGSVPDGLELDHLCRVRCCVNPRHLEPVTRQTNLLRGVRKTLVTTCKNGHPFDGRNARQRLCSTCRREYSRAYKKRIKTRG